MKRSLRDSKGKHVPDQETISNMAQQVDPNALHQVNDVLNQYQGKSEEELFAALKNMTQSEKQNGNLNNTQLESFAKQISPMLSGAQKSKLQNILKTLRD